RVQPRLLVARGLEREPVPLAESPIPVGPELRAGEREREVDVEEHGREHAPEDSSGVSGAPRTGNSLIDQALILGGRKREMTYGILLIRIVVGIVFMGHGSQKLFGWFGGPGLRGTANGFGQLGYRSPERMAILAGLAELG